MGLNLYFLRHGETSHSHEDAFCGVSNPPLTEKGIAMAEAFAKAYGDFEWRAVYASPMQRTRETADPICKHLGLEPIIRDGLKEMNFGQWENLDRPVVQQRYSEDYVRWLTEPAWNSPPDGETAVEVASRAALVIAEITESHEQGNILIVSHKSTIRILLCHLLGLDLGRYRDRIAMKVSAVSLVRIDSHGPMLMKLGDRAHLPAEITN